MQFRKWAGQIVKDYTIQGWTMDKERIIISAEKENIGHTTWENAPDGKIIKANVTAAKTI